MTKERDSLPDKLFRHGIGPLSAACVRWPQLVGGRVMGDHPVRWRVAKTRASELGNAWNIQEGYPLSGGLPVDYRRAVELYTDRSMLQDQLAKRGGVGEVAGAFAVSDTVFVADLKDAATNPTTDYENLDDVRVTFGVGREALRATLVIRNPETNELEAAPAGVIKREWTLDVQEDERISLADLQNHFPDAYYL